MKIILASASPRRRALLGIIFPEIEIMIPDTDERHRPGESPLNYARRVSQEKLEAVTPHLPGTPGPMLAITSDTIVTIDDRVLGKPSGYGEAFNTLTLLNGRSHRVITALTMLYRYDEKNAGITETDHEITGVTFRELSNDEIKHYLSVTEYMDKAGSYAIQENGALIIESISGSLSNVVGFPMRLFYRMLMRTGAGD